MTKTLQEHTDEIMDYFDFRQVHKAMVALGWTWADTEEGIPSEAELRQRARHLIKYAYEAGTDFGEPYTVGTGGFFAEYAPEHDIVRLYFQLREWESHGE